jgi:osmotically-inducible protein OsmY
MRRGWMVVVIVALCGCSEDVDRLGRIFQKSAAKFESATDRMRDRLQIGSLAQPGASLEPSLENRVTLRIRWDAELSGVSIQAYQLGSGTIELTGTVSELTQQRRAIELAQTTVGVEKVLDRLTLTSDENKP